MRHGRGDARRLEIRGTRSPPECRPSGATACGNRHRGGAPARLADAVPRRRRDWRSPIRLRSTTVQTELRVPAQQSVRSGLDPACVRTSGLLHVHVWLDGRAEWSSRASGAGGFRKASGTAVSLRNWRPPHRGDTTTFDISVLELFMPLCYGAAVIVAETEWVRDRRSSRRSCGAVGNTAGDAEYWSALRRSLADLGLRSSWSAVKRCRRPGLRHDGDGCLSRESVRSYRGDDLGERAQGERTRCARAVRPSCR